MPTAAAATTSGTSERLTRSEPSRRSTTAENSRPATANRLNENASGSHHPNAYFVVA